MPRVELPPPEVRERIAINLFDLSRIDAAIRPMLVGGKLVLSEAIRVDRDLPDETAVEFSCPPLEAAAICDIVRGHDRRAGDYPCRCYLRRATAWRRIPADRLLTLVLGGEVVLNPELFTELIETIAPEPLPTRPF